MLLYRKKIFCKAFLAIFAFQCVWAAQAMAESKSGVEPQVISLPTGPGSIEGLGESFEPLLNTGMATYMVDIAVSPGVNKHQPEVALEYNGGYGNSPLGIGWDLNIEYVQRQTEKGLPAYTQEDTFIYNKGGELVPLANNIYRLKIEGLFVRFEKCGDTWKGWRKNGAQLFFGTAVQSRQETPRGTFIWFIDREIDTNGNEIQYFYESDNGKTYLSEIRYSIVDEGLFKSVRFSYEARPDAFTDYRSRSKVATKKRLAGIEILSNEDLVRKYLLAYKPETNLSLLSKVTQIGADGQSALPPVKFEYTEYVPDAIRTISMTDPPPAIVSGSNNNVDLVDIDGDSLPDLVHTSPYDGTHYFYLNEGRGKWAADAEIPQASPQHFLATDGVMMSDMNGDGLADLFVKNSETFGYFQNRGNLKWEAGYWTQCAPNPNFSFESKNVRMLDVNNDKLIDAIVDAGSEYYVWLNRKDNQWNEEFDFITNLPDGNHLGFASPYTKTGDMNGDRMQDLVLVMDDHISYFPGMGNGQFDSETIMGNPPQGISGMEDLLALSDIDSDGLCDVVRIGNENITVWFNAGNQAFEEAPKLFEGTPPFLTATCAFRFADMNGDGFTDLLMIDGNSSAPYKYVDFNNGIHPNLLSKIDNGLGREIAIEYRSSTDFYLEDRDNGTPWTTKLPFPVRTVSRVTVKDRNSGDEYPTEYRYRDGYYDGVEKEFRGFGGLDKIVPGDGGAPTLTTRYAFDVGKDEESRKGLATSIAGLAEGGSIDPPLGIFDIASNDIATNDLHTGENGERVRFSYISGVEASIYENTSTPKQLFKEIVQDSYGNTAETSDYGIVEGEDLSVGNDEVRTFTDFLIDETRWIVGLPEEIRVEDLNGAFVSHQKNHYDENTGNLLRQENAVSENVFITTLENSYDSYGNVVQTTDANGHWRKFAYDPLFHTFPISESIQVSEQPEKPPLAMAAEYDTGLGVVTSFTDYNGNVTLFDYDVFGRVSGITKPGDSRELPTQQFFYTLADPVSSVSVKKREIIGTDNTYDTVTYYDGLGRKLQTKSEGPSGNWIVTDAVQFNAKGDIQNKWLPFFSASDLYQVPDFSMAHIDYEYDAKGRTVKEINPDGSFKSTVYEPLENVVYDEEDNGSGTHAGTPHRFIRDGFERIVEVREKNGDDEPYVTRYWYDGQDNPTKIKDNQGNDKIIQYDGLGRKTYMNDPDKHEMTYVYDPVGNLVSTTDAKEQTVTYTYDAANRILTEEHNGMKVRYHYDDDLSDAYPDFSNTSGKISYVEDEAGTEYYSYDIRGNIVVKVRKTGDYSFVNRFAYDAMDRVSAMTYPDGFTLTYRYNDMNRLAGIPGFVSGIEYTPSGQLSQITYENGVRSQHDYDSRWRMKRLKSEVSGKILQDFSYTYDAVSNIANIADGRPEKTTEDQTREFAYDDLYRLVSAVAPDWTREYRYDSIGNMVFKTDMGVMTYGGNGAGPHAVTGAAGAGISYAYDENGNIAAKIPSYIYRFDHNDRMVGATRLEDNADIAYEYDFQGNRVVKRIAGDSQVSTTVYADKFTELRQNTLIKQVFAENRLVARLFSTFDPALIETRLNPLTFADFDQNPEDGKITLEEIRLQGKESETIETRDVEDALRIYFENIESNPDKITFETISTALHETKSLPQDPETSYFYLPDHLGSPCIVTDTEGIIVEESTCYPYGENRARAGEFESEYRFTGKELDDETGLYYFGARFYDSKTGRFISVDPLYVNPDRLSKERKSIFLTKPKSQNNQAYGESNPLKYYDPNGLENIIVLNKSSGAGNAGHSAVVIEKDGEYFYFSKGAKFVVTSSIHGLVGMADIDNNEAGYKKVSPDILLAKINEDFGESYDGYFIYETDKESALQAYDYASNPMRRYEIYSLAFANCKSFVRKTLEKAGIPTKNFIYPNNYYSNIVDPNMKAPPESGYREFKGSQIDDVSEIEALEEYWR